MSHGKNRSELPDPRVRSRKDGRESVSRPLDIVQRWFQAVITHPQGVTPGLQSELARAQISIERNQLEKVVRRSRRQTAHERLEVYANAYYARLVECLAECYPVFRRTVGQETFNGFAFEYLQYYPPRSYTLDHLGQHFSRFLQESRPDSDPDSSSMHDNWPDFLIDLATLEWVIGQIFDGPGAEQQEILGPEDLRKVPVEQFALARMEPVVCLRLLKFRYPVNAYYSAIRRDGNKTGTVFSQPAREYVAITRREYIVRRFPLSRIQYLLLSGLQKGDPVGEAIATAAGASAEDDHQLATQLRSWFHLWTAEHFFRTLRLP